MSAMKIIDRKTMNPNADQGSSGLLKKLVQKLLPFLKSIWFTPQAINMLAAAGTTSFVHGEVSKCEIMESACPTKSSFFDFLRSA